MHHLLANDLFSWADDIVYAVLADEWRGRDASGTGVSRRAAPAAQNE